MNAWDRDISMQAPVIVAGMDKLESEGLCRALENGNYSTIAKDSTVNLEKTIQETACLVLILDLDNLSVNNRLIRQLRRGNPGLPIIGLSSSPYHPELEEAMSSHICACLRKPPDLDELVYCIKSFCNKGILEKKNLNKEEKPDDAE
jgi:DNA-binding NtrC family response regulator